MNLPAWLNRSRNGALLGLSFEDNGLAVVRVRRVNGQCQVKEGLIVPLTAERVLADPAEAGRLLAGVLGERGLGEKRCAVRLPLAWAMGVPLELPDLAGEDLASFLELRAEREFPFPPGRMALAHHRFTFGANASWGLLVGLDESRVEAVRRLLETAGLEPVSIALGLGGCVLSEAPEKPAGRGSGGNPKSEIRNPKGSRGVAERRLSEGGESEERVSEERIPRTSDFPSPRPESPIGTPDEDVTASRNAALHVCPAGAGLDLILTVGADLVGFRHLGGAAGKAGATHVVTAAELAREIRLTRGRLPAELREAFRTVRFHGPEGRVGELFRATEPLLRARGWETVERVPCRPLPTDNGPLPAPAEPALEVACRHLTGEPAAFEFLPPRVNRWQQAFHRYGRGRRRQAILAGVALLLALAAPAWLQSRKLAGLRARWSEMEPRVRQLETVQENIRKFRSWFSNQPVSLEVLQAVAAAFPEKGTVWARTLELKPGGVFTCNGLARNNQEVMATLDRLRKDPRVTELKVRQMRGRDPVQFSFQFTWRNDARS